MKWAALVFLIVGCAAPEDEFYGKVFLCDVEKGAPYQCGRDRAGKPMVCYPGHLLGGSDFCSETCDPRVAPSDGRYACIDAISQEDQGALIQKCTPSGKVQCPKGLSCYRTDVLKDEGLCVSTLVCTGSSGCSGNSMVCSSALAGVIGDSSLGISTDNLHCVQRTCSTMKSGCLSDMGCLFDEYASGGSLPDICVPKCEQGECPPNFACAKQPSAPGSKPLCVPGIPGTRCVNDIDCLVGDCLDTGAGFKVCAIAMSCAEHDDCRLFDRATDKFICAKEAGICVQSRPYAGGNCTDQQPGECLEGEECRFYSPFTKEVMHGECRTPCPDGQCQPRGGIPYVCVGAAHEGGCYPTHFGLPCASDADCLDGLGCMAAGPDERSLHNYSPSLCTAACTSDEDCGHVRLIANWGFCDLEAGICRRRGQPGAPCSRDGQCYSDRCPEGTCQ